MIKFVRIILLASLGLLTTLCAAQETIAFEWTITEYEDETANVGDTIQFEWSGNHNVYIHPTGSCDETDAILVGEESGASYIFTEEDAGTDVYFSCDVGDHCEFGQFVKFTVAAGESGATISPVSTPSPVTADSPTAQETITFEWTITEYEDETANVGDTIQFEWSGNHNVYIHPTGSCDETDAILVGEESGASYVFTEEDAGTDVYFSCDVGDHCEFGQFVKFTVAAGESEATNSPVSTPSPVTAAPSTIVADSPVDTTTDPPFTSPTNAPVDSPTVDSSAAKHGQTVLGLSFEFLFAIIMFIK